MLVIFFPITTHKMQKQAEHQPGTRSWNRSQPIPGPGLEISEPVQPGPVPIPKFLDSIQLRLVPVPENWTGYPIPLILSPWSEMVKSNNVLSAF